MFHMLSYCCIGYKLQKDKYENIRDIQPLHKYGILVDIIAGSGVLLMAIFSNHFNMPSSIRVIIISGASVYTFLSVFSCLGQIKVAYPKLRDILLIPDKKLPISSPSDQKGESPSS